ncbi:sodium-dependent transporter [Clostridium botulinum]|nr:sodium-dependent transporter [Clostridium botulinum]
MKYVNNREKFSSSIGLFFATLGSAVGLGNIWKFPYLLGDNGGGAFLLIYILCVFFLGIPVMISELYIGRNTRSNFIGAMKLLRPKSRWHFVGYLGIMSCYFITFFYTAVAGWVYAYVFKALRSDFINININEADILFNKTISNATTAILWQISVLIVVSFILICGVQKGIEKISKTLMPVLFILIILCCVRALTLPGARQGIDFLFRIDFSKVTINSIIIALGLAFFKLAVGSGTMVTYGSYFTENTNIINTAIKVAFSDTLVSILAGIAIFPAVFSFNMQPTAGPGLLFMSIPLVFSKIPMGNILLILFFILTSIAATTAITSMFQVLVAYYTEEKNISRKRAVIFNAIIIIIIGSLATLSSSPQGVIGNIKIYGKTFFELFDYMSSNILLPLGGFLITIFTAYINKKENIVIELSNRGLLNNSIQINVYWFIIKIFTPVLLFVVLISSLGIIKF